MEAFRRGHICPVKQVCGGGLRDHWIGMTQQAHRGAYRSGGPTFSQVLELRS